VSTVQVLTLSSLTGAVVGALGILFAVRERRRGSGWWVWLVPGVFGALLCVLSLVQLVGAA
jgi:uncharacterized membrane protein HdeD (DUF308 family)